MNSNRCTAAVGREQRVWGKRVHEATGAPGTGRLGRAQGSSTVVGGGDPEELGREAGGTMGARSTDSEQLKTCMLVHKRR